MEGWKQIATLLIASFEGCEKRRKDDLIHPYLDKLAKPNVWTRGYGRTYRISESSPPITKDEALLELQAGVIEYSNKILIFSPDLIKKPICLASITSWAWNCGIGAYQRSRLRKAINSERWEDASELIKKPRTAGGVEYRGLVKRRDVESVLFTQGYLSVK